MSNGEPYVSQHEIHAGDTEWGEEGADLYEGFIDQFIEDYDDFDQAAAELVYLGWFDGTASQNEINEARMALFAFYDIEIEDFPWEDWRDWYEA